MNFDLTDDQREIRRTAREFLAARYPPEQVRAIALDGASDPHWDEIAELGWPDIAELGTVELAVLAEQLGYALAPSPLAATWAAKLLYPALAWIGRELSDPSVQASPVWFPSGLVLSALLVTRLRHWPVVALTAIAMGFLTPHPERPWWLTTERLQV